MKVMKLALLGAAALAAVAMANIEPALSKAKFDLFANDCARTALLPAGEMEQTAAFSLTDDNYQDQFLPTMPASAALGSHPNDVVDYDDTGVNDLASNTDALRDYTVPHLNDELGMKLTF